MVLVCGSCYLIAKEVLIHTRQRGRRGDKVKLLIKVKVIRQPNGADVRPFIGGQGGI